MKTSFTNVKPPVSASNRYSQQASQRASLQAQTYENLITKADTKSLHSSTQYGAQKTADQTSQKTGSRAQTAGRQRGDSNAPSQLNQKGSRVFSHARVQSSYSRVNNQFTKSNANVDMRGLAALECQMQSSREGETAALFSTREPYRGSNVLNTKLMTTYIEEEQSEPNYRAKQRPQTSKRTRPAIKSMASIQNLRSMRQMGPSSTKNITSGGPGLKNFNYFRHGNIFLDENNTRDEEDQKDLTSQFLDLSQPGDKVPEHMISVAERSVLSQNFVHGTEETEESIVGVEKKKVEKPIAYAEFKEAVRREADFSTAPTHEEFMWEVSETWKAMRYAQFKSIGLNSFKKAQAENELTLYHELQEDEYFRNNPHLLEFKKKNYIDPDILAARRAGKHIPCNKLIKDRSGYEFGLYKRFDWENPAIQKSIRMGTKTEKNIGPGSYHSGGTLSKDKKGMFNRSRREFKRNGVPGPGFYFQNGVWRPETERDQYTFPRKQRNLPGENTKPDYDMSVFYVDKGPGVRPKIGGYTISNTGGTDAVIDPSKKSVPGVASYEIKHAYERSTFHREGPAFSIPQNGSYSIDACLNRASNSPMKKDKKPQLQKTVTIRQNPNSDL